MSSVPYYAGGFFFNPRTRRVLLNLRGQNAPMSPGMWSCFGGVAEEEDGGDPVATWCRETREELGLDISAAQVKPVYVWVSKRDGQLGYFFYAEWPLIPDFVGPEGEEFVWFPLEDAIGLPNMPGAQRRALEQFRDAIAQADSASAH